MKIALIVAIIAGQNPFQMMGMQTPSAFEWAMNNKVAVKEIVLNVCCKKRFQLSSCMLLFFIGNAIEGQLISTGAFEVSFNGSVFCVYYHFFKENCAIISFAFVDQIERIRLFVFLKVRH